MYKFRPGGAPGVIDTRDNTVIPPDPSGHRWREYMQWMYSGNEALPADPPPPVQVMLSKMTVINRLTAEEAEAIEAARPFQPAKDRLMWEAASEIDPSHSVIVAFLDAVIGEERRIEVLKVG